MDFNLGKSQTKDMMPFVRIAVERYLYERLGENIQAIYNLKHRAENELFTDKQRQLFEAYKSKHEVMDFLGIKASLQLVSPESVEGQYTTEEGAGSFKPSNVPYK